MKIPKFILSLSFFLVPFLGHAYEQDNWYLHGPIDGNLSGVFHQEYNATSKRDMLYKTATGVGLEVRDINGSLLQTINTGGITFTDIEFDQNASRLFGINASKLTCFEQNASGGWSEQWRSTQSVSTMTQGPSGNLFCANNGNKIYVFEQNGTMSNEFGWVDGINSLSGNANITGFAPSGTLVLRGKLNISGGSSTYRTFYFRENGEQIRNWHSSSYDSSSYLTHARISPSGILFIRGDNSSSHYFFHPDGDTIPDPNLIVNLWLQNGDFISGSNLYRRTFRTKMETNHNSVPQPVIHRIAQRTGTNVMELDFEVIDTDDDNVTVGILAYCGLDKLVPQAWLNGTGSKIGTPIATNTVHTMEWDVKQDWNSSTGSIKFEILCQDGNRTQPVDLHFLTLPFSDVNMTISRSPLKEADFLNYAKFLLATRQLFEFGSYFGLEAENNATTSFTFTTSGAVGTNGPTWNDINNTYAGTNLEGNVSMSIQGIQEWTVPSTGYYSIAAVGAAGGVGGGGSLYRSSGALVKGEFLLNQGDVLKILVGQRGTEHPNANATSGDNTEGAGGGGTFVVNGTTPLLIAGGGNGTGDSAYRSENRIPAIDAVETNATRSSQGPLGGRGFSSFPSSMAGINGMSRGGSSNGGFGGGGGAGDDGRHGGGGGGYVGGWQGTAATSYNSGENPFNNRFTGTADGVVWIASGRNLNYIPPVAIISKNHTIFKGINASILRALGNNYRWATPEEVTKAREAATPGAVNNWTASNQVKPRNLPGKVNEYGFDVSTTSGFWVIKE